MSKKQFKKKHSKSGSGQFDQLSSLNTPNPVHPEDLNDEEEPAASPSVAKQRQLAMAGPSSSAAQKGCMYSSASNGNQGEGGMEPAYSRGKKVSKWPFRKSKKDKEKEKGKQFASKGKSEQLVCRATSDDIDDIIVAIEAEIADREQKVRAQMAVEIANCEEKLRAEFAEQLDREKRGMEEDKEKWKTEEIQTWKAKEEKWNEEKQQELTALMEAKQKLEEKLEESSKQLEEVNQKFEQEKKQTDADMKNRNELMLEMTTKTVQAKEAEIDKLKAILESKTKQHQEEMTKQAVELTEAFAEQQRVHQEEMARQTDEMRKQAGEFTEQQRVQQSKMEDLEGQLREKTRHEQERENLVRENSERLERQLEEEKDRHQQEKEGLLEKHEESLRQAKEEWTKQLNQQLEQTEQIKDELTQRLKEEGDRTVADIANSLREVEGERDRVKGELEVVRQDLLRVQGERDDLAEQLKEEKEEEQWEEQHFQEMVQKHKRAEKEMSMLKQKLSNEKAKVQQLQEQLEQKMKLSEEETTTTNMKSLLGDEEMCELHGSTISGPSLAEWNDLKAKVSQLEQQNKELQRIHLDNPVPSNVHQFCHQLSKLVDPEGESAQTTPRPLPLDTAMQALQLLGVGSDFKSRGYIVSIFTACNKMQSTLLDYTRIGEVVQFKVHDAGVDSGDERSPHSSMNTDKSPYTSLTEVKVEVTDGNMTDADKLDLQQMLRESQKALESLHSEKESLLSEKEGLYSEKESLRSENESLQREKESLMEHIEVLEAQFYLSDARSAPESADTAKSGQGQPRSDADKLRQMKKNYLKVHNEMMQLMEKVKERDDQLKELRDGFGKTNNPPVNNQDPHQQPSDLPSPEDLRAEVDKLRATLDKREEKIHNLTMQLRSLQGLGQDKLCYEAKITELNKLLVAANAEIEELKVGQTHHEKESESPEVVAQGSEHWKMAENEKQELEFERDVWRKEIEAEKGNNQKLQSEVNQFQAKLESKKQEVVRHPLSEESSSEQNYQIQIADLQRMLAAKEDALSSQVALQCTLKNQLLKCEDERERLNQQNVELLAMKANLKRSELSYFDDVKQGLAAKVQNSLKSFEAEPLKKSEEPMIGQIKRLQDEIEAWKHEVATIKEDFYLERRDWEKYASSRDEEIGRWRVEKQQYEASLSHLTHEFKQREFQLTRKLEEMSSRYEKAIQCQREVDELCDKFREERDTFCMEMQKTHELYEEKRQHHKNIVLQLEGEKEHHLKSLYDRLQLIEVEKCSMQTRIAQLEDEKKKSEKICETTAAMKRQVDAKLQEVTAKLHASEQQSQLYFAKLQQQGRKLEEYITNASKVSDELMSMTQDRNHYKTQSELQGRKLEEYMASTSARIIQLEDELVGRRRYEAAKQKEYEEEMQSLRSRLTHEFEQREFQLTYKLSENAQRRQRELETQCDNLRSQRNSCHMELNEMRAIYEEEKKHIQNLQFKLSLAEREKHTMQELLERLEGEKENLLRDKVEAEREYEELHTQWVVERREIQLTGPELGRGAWGAVSVATFRGTCVAAKCIHHQIISEYNAALLKREMNMAAKIRHPNLLQFIGATRSDEVIILMELMPTSLRKKLESRPKLLLKQVTSISADVARALSYLHLMQPHPLIHRDISSANILLQPLPNDCWRAKVSDYGTVQLLQKLQTAGPGNPTYAAPEAIDPKMQSPKMDIFSFGVLLLEMLTGEFPDFDERARQLRKISRHQLNTLVLRCLRQDRDERPSASDIIRDLGP